METQDVSRFGQFFKWLGLLDFSSHSKSRPLQTNLFSTIQYSDISRCQIPTVLEI